MKRKMIGIIALVIMSIAASAAVTPSSIPGITVTESSCDGGYFITSTRESTDKIVTYDSCESDGIKINKSLDPWAVAKKDGNFSLLNNGVVTCEGSALGDVGTFDGVEYTTVSEGGLRGMAASGDVSGACTSKVKSMEGLFYENTTFNQSLDHFDTSNVTGGMSAMFYGATAFNQPLDNFDTSNVARMNVMFFGATAFNQSLDNFDTSNVTDMSNMFHEASAFNQSLDSFDTSNVTNMSNMFFRATAFNQSLDSFDTSNVVKMSSMFQFTAAFNQSLAHFDTSNVTNMKAMFYEAVSFNQDLTGWDVSNISSEPESFDDNSALDENNLPIWGTTGSN